MKEIWKDIPNYEGLYQVSNLGNVRNVKRNKIKSININNRGYKLVWLNKNNKGTNALVHRLVAQAFIPNINNLPQVNHKDENKLNNKVENLEWCTQKYNNSYGTRVKRMSETKMHKVKQFDKEGNFIKEWNSAYDIENELNILAMNVRSVCHKTRKTAGGFKWTYSNN
jgi:hypothetical protein